MGLEIKIYSCLFGKKIGVDLLGNKYYISKKSNKSGNKKRWVVYKGVEEASKVPSEWFNWLHHTTDEVPVNVIDNMYKWQKPSLPNLTGTKYAYKPSGHPQGKGCRDKATGDYEAWNP